METIDMEAYLIICLVIIAGAYQQLGFKDGTIVALIVLGWPIYGPLWLIYKGGRWVLSSELRILGLIGFISFLLWLNSKAPDPFW